MKLATISGHRLARGAESALSLVRSLANRRLISALNRSEKIERERTRVAGPTIAQRRADLLAFYELYEEVVEVLCDAAQYGPASKLDERYLALRDSIVRGYAPVRPFVIAYLRFSTDDAELGMKLTGKSTDAFEALVGAPTLEEFIRLDDGGMISRITRTREALNLYGEHLRQLEACAK